jgi:small conductance mechanosensitive channel
MSEHLLKYLDIFVSMAMQYIPQVILALITLWLGFWLVRTVVRGMKKALLLQHVDPSLTSFLDSSVTIVLKILVIMTVAMMVGIQMTSFIAILGAAGLAVGLSLQGSLANLAGGILILVFKPFAVGEEISAMAQKGVVEKIEIFATILRGENETMIIIPNGPLSNGVIINYSRHSIRNG